MQVRDWMTAPVETVAPGDDIASVAERFRTKVVRQFPVVEDGRLVGIITDRDVRSATDHGAAVATAMSPQPVTATPGLPVEEAARLVLQNKIGALPVLEDDHLVGIVSESDLLDALIELCDVLEPTTFIEVECGEGEEELARVRALIERHGGRVPWITGTPHEEGRQIVALRACMRLGKMPEQVLEEAGLRVLSSISGRQATSHIGA